MSLHFDTPLYTSDQSVDRVLAAGLPVTLVFSDGQLPTALESTLKNLARQYAGQMLFAQLTLKDSPQTARRYTIQAAPAVVTVKQGETLSQAERVDSGELERHVSFLLGRGPRPEVKREPPAPGAPSSASSTDGQSGRPVAVTDQTFEQEVMRSALPVVVDFWAPWCGPCRMVAPVLEKLAREWNGKVKIAKINVDENPRFAGQYGVQAIPTMMVVKNGQVVDRWAGALPEPAMRSRLGGILR
jgi:thioredoxin 1